MANINIDIAAEFTGAKAFKKAETATDQLTKGVKGFGKTLGIAFGAQQILAYGKASLKAAADDEKGQKQLALALKNVGLERDVASSEGYIQKLQKEFGVLDDQLRPAYQTLAVATRDTAQAQKLLQLSLDISASTGKDLSTVSAALSKAFLGNNTALSKLGVGISKADLKAGKFEDIVSQLSKTFAGAATQSANTFQGSMDKLAVASNNAKEIIGKGLIDALTNLGDSKDAEKLATDMENVATSIADAVRGLGEIVAWFKKIQDFGASIPFIDKLQSFIKQLNPLFMAFKSLQEIGKASEKAAAAGQNNAQGLAHLAELQAAYAKLELNNSKKLTAEELKQLQAKRLKNAIDKANLALGKGTDVFDMEKIQLQAAELNQAQLLGKVTSQAQLLQITNDMARLQVKKDILALEDAIKSNDAAAIEAATAKLNKDLGILGVLTNQKIKLEDIKSILESIVPKDLINLANLDAAIAKLKEIAAGTPTTPTAPVNPAKPTTPSDTGSTYGYGTSVFTGINKYSVAAAVAGRAGNTISGINDPRVTYGGQRIDSAGNYVGYNADMAGAFSYAAGRAGQSSTGNTVNVTVEAGLGDPNAIAETVTKVIQDAIDRGTIRDFSLL
jgi:hypothetical protein